MVATWQIRLNNQIMVAMQAVANDTVTTCSTWCQAWRT